MGYVEILTCMQVTDNSMSLMDQASTFGFVC